MIATLKLASISAVLSAGLVSGWAVPGSEPATAMAGKLYYDRAPTSLVSPASASLEGAGTFELRDEAQRVSVLVRGRRAALTSSH